MLAMSIVPNKYGQTPAKWLPVCIYIYIYIVKTARCDGHYSKSLMYMYHSTMSSYRKHPLLERAIVVLIIW